LTGLVRRTIMVYFCIVRRERNREKKGADYGNQGQTQFTGLMNGVAIVLENVNNIATLAAMERNSPDCLDSAHDRNGDDCRGAFGPLGRKRNFRRRHQAQYESSDSPVD